MSLDERYEIAATARFLRGLGARAAALQFPDEALRDAPAVVAALGRRVAGGDGGAQQRIRLSVLGDSTFGACCVDEVAAAHTPCDAVVHYGHACMSAPAALPVLYVFGAAQLDVRGCAAALRPLLPADDVASDGAWALLLWDPDLTHAIPRLLHALASGDAGESAAESHCDDCARLTAMYGDAGITAAASGDAGNVSDWTWEHWSPRRRLVVPSLPRVALPRRSSSEDAPAAAPTTTTTVGFVWRPPGDASGAAGAVAASPMCRCRVIYVGARAARLQAIVAQLSPAAVWAVDPGQLRVGDAAVTGDDGAAPVATLVSGKDSLTMTSALTPPASSSRLARLMSRRYRAVEAVRGAQIVALIAGTTGVGRHAAVLDALRAAAAAAGVATYTIVVGRPTPAKLANFPEAGAFVLVACPENALLGDAEYGGGGGGSSTAFAAPIATPWEALVAWAPMGAARRRRQRRAAARAAALTAPVDTDAAGGGGLATSDAQGQAPVASIDELHAASVARHNTAGAVDTEGMAAVGGGDAAALEWGDGVVLDFDALLRRVAAFTAADAAVTWGGLVGGGDGIGGGVDSDDDGDDDAPPVHSLVRRYCGGGGGLVGGGRVSHHSGSGLLAAASTIAAAGGSTSAPTASPAAAVAPPRDGTDAGGGAAVTTAHSAPASHPISHAPDALALARSDGRGALAVATREGAASSRGAGATFLNTRRAWRGITYDAVTADAGGAGGRGADADAPAAPAVVVYEGATGTASGYAHERL